MAKVTLRPHYQFINGIRCAAMFSPKCFKEALNYKPKPDDIFIVTYPKCGTTWMQTVVLYIFRKGKELDNQKDFFKLCPFIDLIGNEGINDMPRPGAIKSHLSYKHIPYSPLSKYIYVLRNPKDCCVSLYHHTRSVGFGYWDGKFDDFFELFMAGEVEYDDYFDHLMSWYPHCKDSQVFFTTFEEMKKDMKNIVLKLATFMGKEYIECIEKDNTILNNILHFSSFEYMKKNVSDLHDSSLNAKEELNNPALHEGRKYALKYALSLNPPSMEKREFIRKGIVGDWKNYLSEEQSKRLNKKFFERTQGTDIVELYKSLI